MDLATKRNDLEKRALFKIRLFYLSLKEEIFLRYEKIATSTKNMNNCGE